MTKAGVSAFKQSSFALSRPGVRMAPSLLAADFSRLAEEVDTVEQAGAEVLHLDVMDGHFVPNISFGVPVIAGLRSRTKMFFDAHLMIADPAKYIGPFVDAGCDLISFHVEAVEDPVAVVGMIHDAGVAAGVALNPTTPESAADAVIDSVELVLVMSVWPGFGGQKFIADVLPKVESLHGRLRTDQRLEIDGGIDPSNIGRAAGAGADLFVAGTSVFRQSDSAEALRHVHALALAEVRPRSE